MFASLARHADRYALGIIVLQVVLWTLVPAAVTLNVHLDVVEAAAWGHEWQWGYHKGAPMSAWAAEIGALIAPGQPWPIFLISQLCIGVTFLAIWGLARRILGPRDALVTLMIATGIYYFTFPTPEFNAIIMQMPFAALAGLLLHRAVTGDRILDWAGLGAVAALGMLSRYSMAMYLVPIAGFLIVHPQARRRLAGPGPYLAALVGLALLAPHLRWLVETDFMSFRYVDGRATYATGWISRFLLPLHFVGAQLLALIPAVLLLFIAISAAPHRRSADGEVAAFDRQVLATLALAPLALVIVISVIAGRGPRSMWGGPLWCFVAPCLVAWTRSLISVEGLRRIGIGWAVLYTLPLIAYAGANQIGPAVTGHDRRTFFPGADIARVVEQGWAATVGPAPLPIAVGPLWLAGNLNFYAQSRPSAVIDGNYHISPWVRREDIDRRGAVLIWSVAQDGDDLPPALARDYPRAREQPNIVLPMQGVLRDRMVRLGWAIIPPSP